MGVAPNVAVERAPEPYRRTIWRATTPKFRGWGAKTRSREPAEVRPERLATLYRQLRKAQEDIKDEPGAADFYYGEMEMRRHAQTAPAAERAIIWLYWLISGYGLRALRLHDRAGHHQRYHHYDTDRVGARRQHTSPST